MKQNTITLERILEYYDAPQLFLGRDDFDTQYLCLLYEDEPTYQYTAIRISTNLYARFLRGEEDLRELFLHPEFESEYFDVAYINNTYVCSRSSFGVITENRLPEAGYRMDNDETETVTISVPKRERSLFDRLMHRHGWVAM